MMAGLFILMSAAIATIFFGKRAWSITLLLIIIVLGFIMLWHHATDVLKINW